MAPCPGNLADLEALHEAGVFGFKCFLLDSGVAEFPHLGRKRSRARCGECARIGALMIVHAEDGALIDAHALDGPSYAGFLASRPPRVGGRRRGPGDAAGDQDRGPGAHRPPVQRHRTRRIEFGRRAGADVSVETCPHYLTFAAEQIDDGSTEFKCCPPIREADNREALWEALGAGSIEMVVSDHSPCTATLKRLELGDFGRAWGGIASVQLGLPAVWTGARARGYSLVDVVQWMAAAPAERVGLRDRGRIAVGAQADLVRFAPEEEFVVDVAQLKHQQPRVGVRRATPRGRGPRDLVARRTGERRCPPGTVAEERALMTLPRTPRRAATADRVDDRPRAVHRGVRRDPARTQSDITASYLPGWDGMRMWVLARPLSGFAETFSWYVAEVSPGGGTEVPESLAESVLFVVDGELS